MAPVLAIQVDGPPRESGKPKKTQMEGVKIDLKCNLSEDLDQDRSEWRKRIYVADRTPTQLVQGFDGDDDDRDKVSCKPIPPIYSSLVSE